MDIHAFVEAMSQAERARDWDRLAGLLDDQVTIVHPGIGAVVGRDANVAVLKFVIEAIDGYARAIDDLVWDGHAGAFSFTITGTHTGDWPGFPATGEPVEISGAMFFTAAGGQLASATEMLNHDSIRRLSLR